MPISSLERGIYSWSSLTPREVLVPIKANFKTGSLRKKKPTFRNSPTGSPPPHPPTGHPRNEPRDFKVMMCHYPHLSSALVSLKICYIQVYFFKTFRQFMWLAFVHARSSPSTSAGSVTTLESRASPGTSPETGRASASHWRPLWEGRPTSEVQGVCWPWRR